MKRKDLDRFNELLKQLAKAERAYRRMDELSEAADIQFGIICRLKAELELLR